MASVNEYEMETFIHVYRAMKRMTQQDLANATGVSRQTIMQLEKNKYNPSLKLAVAIADELEGNITDIFKFKKKE